MAGAFITVEILGQKYIIDTSVETIKRLLYSHAAGGIGHAPDSLINADTGSDYSVTAGKTLTVLGIIWMQPITANTIYSIYQGDTADAITLLKTVINVIGSNGANEIPTSFTVAASKFVTFDPAVDIAAASAVLIGYES